MGKLGKIWGNLGILEEYPKNRPRDEDVGGTNGHAGANYDNVAEKEKSSFLEKEGSLDDTIQDGAEIMEHQYWKHNNFRKQHRWNLVLLISLQSVIGSMPYLVFRGIQVASGRGQKYYMCNYL